MTEALDFKSSQHLVFLGDVSSGFSYYEREPSCPYLKFMYVKCNRFDWRLRKAVCQFDCDSFSRCCFLPSCVSNGYHEVCFDGGVLRVVSHGK